MRRMLRYLLPGAVLLCVACGPRSRTTTAAFDRPLYTPRHASGFELLGRATGASVLLRVHNPWQGAEGVETSLLLLRDGEEAPADFGGQVLRHDPQRIVCMSSTHIAMLDAAGAVSRIVGVSGPDYVSNAYIAAHRDAIGDVGYEGNIDYETLLAVEPDLVLLFGLNGASGMERRLGELGIPYVYVGDYLEESPLGKAEWLVAVGELVGRRAEAEALFAGIPIRYNALKERVAASGRPRPKVMLNTPYADAWFMAPQASYVAQTVADAGGDYLYKKNTTTRSLPIDLEEAALLVGAADVWLNVGTLRTLDELRRSLPKFADAPCVVRGDVWNCNRRTNAAGGNDYWESGVVHPDLVLRDLVQILHPGLIAEEPFVYYLKLE